MHQFVDLSRRVSALPPVPDPRDAPMPHHAHRSQFRTAGKHEETGKALGLTVDEVVQREAKALSLLREEK